MLAGRMKLNTFLLLAGASGGALVAGLGVWFATRPPEPEPVYTPAPVAIAAPVVEAPAPAAPVGATPAAPAAAPATAREVDAVVLSYVGKDIGSDKLKDVTKGKSYKVNVYQDAGKPTANRAKIDLDRDDKWDEKITYDGDAILREVAPNDDEVYTEKSRWNGSDWAAGG